MATRMEKLSTVLEMGKDAMSHAMDDALSMAFFIGYRLGVEETKAGMQLEHAQTGEVLAKVSELFAGQNSNKPQIKLTSHKGIAPTIPNNHIAKVKAAYAQSVRGGLMSQAEADHAIAQHEKAQQRNNNEHVPAADMDLRTMQNKTTQADMLEQGRDLLAMQQSLTYADWMKRTGRPLPTMPKGLTADAPLTMRDLAMLIGRSTAHASKCVALAVAELEMIKAKA